MMGALLFTFVGLLVLATPLTFLLQRDLRRAANRRLERRIRVVLTADTAAFEEAMKRMIASVSAFNRNLQTIGSTAAEAAEALWRFQQAVQRQQKPGDQ